MRKLCAALATILTLVTLPVSAQQGTAELRGVVVDQQQAILPGVTVTARNEDTGMFRETTSNPDGTYFFSGIIPGMYELRAVLSGFKQYTRPGVRLEVGRTMTVNVTLEIGQIQEAVTVAAETPLIDLTSNEIGGLITSRELTEMPSVNRNFIGFVGMLPGIVPNISTESFGSDAVVVNGTDSRNNNYLVDGANNNDDVIGQRAGTQARTPIEAIQEFQVLTHQFDAEFGRTTGAVINAVTKQGTNRLRGSAFLFSQDAALTSRDFFVVQNNLAKPETQQQQFGGTIGGPIVRDKAHFFFSVERVRVDRATTINIAARPEFNTATTTKDRVLNTILRFDQQVNTNNTWGVRWLRESSPQMNQVVPVMGRQVTLNAAREETDVDQTTVGTLGSVIGNSRLNTVRVAFTRENVSFGNPGFNSNGRRQVELAPTLQYLTFVDQQSEVAQARINNAYSFDDTLSWFIPHRGGNHDVRFGIQYQLTEVDNTNQGTLNGFFTFRGDEAFNAALPATYPERLQIRVPGPSDFSMKAHFASAFAQDKWQLADRLTLSLGLRYDIEITPFREENNPAFTDPGAYPVDKNNVSPRVGFAYAVGPAKRSVLRGGYGLFYDKTHFELISAIISAGVFSDSFLVNFPANAADPGPSRGERPSEPLLRDGPVVNRDLIEQLFPPGSRVRNTGTVFFDDPNRRIPSTHQMTIGFERQLGAYTSASVDYVHANGRDLFMSRDLNPGQRVDTSRTGTVLRVDPAFTTSVLQRANLGRTTYDALELHVDKRLSRNFSAKMSYTLSYSRGNTSGNGIPQSLLQVFDDLRLDANEGPTDFDRRHNFVVGGTARIPRTGGLTFSGVARALSGLPFSLIDSNMDPDRNGILFDLLPAGSYEGSGTNAISVDYNGKRNGAYGPGFFQVDIRVGYRLPAGADRTLDVFGEMFNVTNRANFDSPTTLVLTHPVADRRLTDFLALRTLRPGGIPRTGQFGIRFGF
jgi:Carboxypeptidase regulatory-like domain/TonB dependent receptor-like, beta-barrel/TonB-dependent Receptor Plug Domain